VPTQADEREKSCEYEIDRFDTKQFHRSIKKSRDVYGIIDSTNILSVKKQSVPFWNTLLPHIDTILIQNETIILLISNVKFFHLSIKSASGNS
jgi:hypothetical protein